MVKFFIYTILIFFNIVYASSFNTMELDNNSNTTENGQQVKEKINYKEMINYLKSSNLSKDMIALGTIYVNGIQDKDSIGETVNADPILAEKYFLKAIEMDDKEADSILGGLYLYNVNMQRLDTDNKKALFHIKKSFESGKLEMASILADLMFRKNDYKEGVKILLKGAEFNDSSSQFSLALLFKKGLRDDNGNYILEKNEDTANFYLNKSCLNENKTKKIYDLCYNNSQYIEMISK